MRSFEEKTTIQQQLSVNLAMPIPSDSVILSKVAFQELKQQQLKSFYWTAKELEVRMNRKNEQNDSKTYRFLSTKNKPLTPFISRFMSLK